MADSTPLPDAGALRRAERFTRERFVHDGELPEDALAPGSARRRALDAALVELDAGAKAPSVAWRREYSLLLGLERVLSEDEPRLADGTLLNPHQVDALSGTLTALMAEVQSQRATATAARRVERAAGGGAEPSSPPPRSPARRSSSLDDDEDDDEPDEEPQDWQDEPADEDDDGQLAEQPEDPNAAKRFWFEHATGAGKTVAALGFVDASRTGGVLILTHRRNLVDQFHGELRDRGYGDRIAAPLLAGKDNPKGPVTVETYQWFVRNAGQISDAYSIVICDEAHTALGEKTSASIRRWDGPGLRRHDGDGRADRPPRHRPLPDADLALRPRAGGAPRRDLAAALHPHPARPGRPHDRQGAAAPRRGRHRVRPGDAGRAAGPAAVQPRDRRPLQDALQRRARRRLHRRRAARLQRRAGVPRRRA